MDSVVFLPHDYVVRSKSINRLMRCVWVGVGTALVQDRGAGRATEMVSPHERMEQAHVHRSRSGTETSLTRPGNESTSLSCVQYARSRTHVRITLHDAMLNVFLAAISPHKASRDSRKGEEAPAHPLSLPNARGYPSIALSSHAIEA